MSENVTVEAVKDGRDWSSTDGKISLTFYTLDITRADGTSEEVDHARKQGGAEPQPGEELEVTFEDGKFRRKMKKVSTFGASPRSTEASTGTAGSHNTSSAGKGGRDLDRSIALQVALKVLSPTINRAVEEGRSALPANVMDAAGELQRFILEAGQRSVQGSGTATAQESASPPASASPAPEQTPASPSLEELAEALGTAGLIGPAQGVVAGYMAAELSLDQQINAVRQLTSTTGVEAPNALASLRTLTEKWSGNPLPLDDPDSSIPF